MAPRAARMSKQDNWRYRYISSWHRRVSDGSLFIAMIGGRYTMPPGMHAYRRNDTWWRLMLFHDPVLLVTPTATIQVAAESLVMWPPGGQPRAHGSETRSWSHSWINCGGSRVEALLKSLPALQPIALPGPAIGDRTLHGLHHELISHAQPDPDILEALLRLLVLEGKRCAALAELKQGVPVVGATQVRGRRKTASSAAAAISRASTGRPPSKLATALGPDASTEPEDVIWVRRHLDRVLDRPVQLAELAHAHGMSIRNLARRFTAVWGVTPAHYHLRARMAYARTLLDLPDTPLATIARAVGYADAFAFSKAFRKHAGISPDAYRKG